MLPLDSGRAADCADGLPRLLKVGLLTRCLTGVAAGDSGDAGRAATAVLGFAKDDGDEAWPAEVAEAEAAPLLRV